MIDGPRLKLNKTHQKWGRNDHDTPTIRVSVMTGDIDELLHTTRAQVLLSLSHILLLLLMWQTLHQNSKLLAGAAAETDLRCL